MDWIIDHIDKEGTPWIKVIAHIRKNNTNEAIVKHPTTIWLDENGIPNPFSWSENNYSCDCNREIFYGEDIDSACSDGRFSVNLENPATGEIIYREYE